MREKHQPFTVLPSHARVCDGNVTAILLLSVLTSIRDSDSYKEPEGEIVLRSRNTSGPAAAEDGKWVCLTDSAMRSAYLPFTSESSVLRAKRLLTSKGFILIATEKLPFGGSRSAFLIRDDVIEEAYQSYLRENNT